MASFAEFIAENFHSDADLIWRLEGPSRAVAVFEAGSLSVEVAFEQREANGPWHVAFLNTTSYLLIVCVAKDRPACQPAKGYELLAGSWTLPRWSLTPSQTVRGAHAIMTSHLLRGQ